MSAAAKATGWPKRFSKYLVSTEANSVGEWRGYCPIHEDPEDSSSPSASFNFLKGKFYCNAGCGGMSIASLWTIVREDLMSGGATDPAPPSRSNVRSFKNARAKKDGENPLPEEADIERWQKALIGSPTALGELLEKRGITRDTIKEFDLGYDVRIQRYTIPIRSADGELLNVRRYRMGAAAGDKMIGITGHNTTNLFPRSVLAAHTEVVLAEGEMDALIGNQFGFPTVTATGGAKRMPEEIAALFAGKTVFICYDADDTGKAGSIKAAMAISKYAEAVYIIRLPLQGKEDLTDYFVKHGHAPKELEALISEAKAGEPFTEREYTSRVTAEAKEVSLENSMSAEHGTDPLAVTVSVAGKVQPSYLLPRKVTFTCDQDWGTRCGKCDMHLIQNGQVTKEIARDNPLLLELIDVSRVKSDQTLAKEVAGAPPTCPRLQVDEDERWNVEELVVMPSVEDRTQDTITPITRRVYNVGEYATPINTVSRVVGSNTTDPRTRRAVFQSWECEQTKTNLDRFEMTAALKKRLMIFQPRKGQTPVEKMRHIAEDLEANVTRIYGRPELHMAYDLVWHSVMDFKFRGVVLGKGWLEMIVIGDTRTGKSEAALRLCDHYEAGVLKSCEGATLAGLVGGAQQTGNSWMITWGTIPLNDRRLVVLDEASGLVDKNIIEQMSAVRSSGRAQVVKIVSQETSARTRLVWVANPPDGRPIKEMARGSIEALQALIKNPEDIARFDLALSAASSDVDSSIINAADPPQVKHRYTSDLSAALVAWAWSRRIEDIVWETAAEEAVLEVAETIGHSYIPEPPLIQAENVRVKIARIATAVAARLFSCDDTGNKVVVKPEHVAAAIELIDLFYGMPSFGYKDYSQRVIRDRERAEGNIKRTKKYLAAHEDVLRGLQFCHGSDFKGRDLEEFAGMQRDEAQSAIRDLMRAGMLRRLAKGYIRMEPALTALIVQMEAEDD